MVLSGGLLCILNGATCLIITYKYTPYNLINLKVCLLVKFIYLNNTVCFMN